jgi:hypothetical protein
MMCLFLNAKEHIEIAHQLLQRVREGEPLASAAAELGIPAGSVEKLRWLARAYPADLCAGLGDEILGRLHLSHLVEVAALDADTRKHLLARAAEERLSVRALKLEVSALHVHPSASNAAVTIGSIAQLEGAAKALDMYVTWPDDRLAQVLGGANGELIRRLAKTGARLKDRMNLDGEAA